MKKTLCTALVCCVAFFTLSTAVSAGNADPNISEVTVSPLSAVPSAETSYTVTFELAADLTDKDELVLFFTDSDHKPTNVFGFSDAEFTSASLTGAKFTYTKGSINYGTIDLGAGAQAGKSYGFTMEGVTNAETEGDYEFLLSSQEMKQGMQSTSAEFTISSTGEDKQEDTGEYTSIDVELTNLNAGESGDVHVTIVAGADIAEGDQFVLFFTNSEGVVDDFDASNATIADEYSDRISLTVDTLAVYTWLASVSKDKSVAFVVENVVNTSTAGAVKLALTTDPQPDKDSSFVYSDEVTIVDADDEYVPVTKVKSLKVEKSEKKKRKVIITWRKHSFKTQLQLQKWNKKKKRYVNVKKYLIKKNVKKKALKKRKLGTKYRIRARKRRTVEGQKYYSDWTKWKKFKTNK